MKSNGENFGAQKNNKASMYGCSHYWCKCAQRKENEGSKNQAKNAFVSWFDWAKRFAYIDDDDDHIFRGSE